MSNVSRGYRLHNPLNIERTKTQWQGMAAQQTDERFIAFQSPEYGIRAAARILQTYQELHGITTMRGVIDRWAPSSENNTAAYIQAVSIWADLDPDGTLNLTDYDTVYRLLRAMARMELGKPPENLPPAWYEDSVWEKGLRLAGLAPSKTLVNSRTVKGAATASTGIVAAIGVLTDTLGLPPEIAEMLPAALVGASSQTVAVIVLAIGLVGAGYSIYARRDDKLNGRL